MSALTAAIDASLLPRAQPRTPLRLVVVSAVPGRVRWFLPELCDREELAAALARTLSALPSVRRAHANPVTGRLLLEFDEHLSTDRMQAEVERVHAEAAAAHRGHPALGLTPGFKAATVGVGTGLAARVALSCGVGATFGVGIAAGVAWYVVQRLRQPAAEARAVTLSGSRSLVRALEPHRAQIATAAALSAGGGAALLVHAVSSGFALDAVISGSTTLLGVTLAGPSGVILLVAVSTTAAVVRAWLRHRSQVTLGNAGRTLQDALRNRLAEHMLALETADLDDGKRRELQAVLTSDVNQLATALDAVWALGDLAITAALLLGGIFYTSTSAGLVALAPMPALVGLSFLFAPRIHAAHATLRDQVVTIGGQVSDSLAGFETIKGFSAERRESERLRLASATYREKSGEALRSLAKFPLALETSVLGALIAGTSLNGRLVRASTLSFGGFNAVMVLTGHLVFPLLSVGVHYDRMSAGRSAYGHIRSTLDRPVESDVHLPRLLHSEIRGEVVFRDVVFSYPGAPTLFSRLSLRFPSRKTTAVVGFSGSGKSTLIKLLLRFREPDSGRVEIDGRDIAGLQRQSVRQAVAVVSQDMKLLHRSVEDNIRLGDPAADRSVVEHYARLAQAEEFILKLPDGYATVLGGEGTTLSGGERQRLGIARALMKPAPILVFDEATSNLDSRTELAIHDVLDGFRERCTVILIAHRLATVRDADHIYLLENGRLAEEGTHDELLSRNGNYRMLWDMQGGNWL